LDILHISDLHFGAHDKALANSLLRHVESQPPDVIVCTGDLADEPEEELLREAGDYLRKLAMHCKLAPPVIVAPGNHDYRKKGFTILGGGEPFFKVFGDYPKSHFYVDQGVWICRFDSASGGALGGSGEIGADEIDAFHNEFEKLTRSQPGFASAIKIAAVHHHPLPVNWDYGFKDRWLTMTNAGSFLSMLLSRRVDLVLHGHEHLQCKSRLWSTLGGEDKDITVISLGATLRKVSNPERNWFARIRVEDGAVSATFHQSTGKKFEQTPAEPPLPVRTAEAARQVAFEEAAARAGYRYREVAANMVLLADGDAWRSVEYQGFRVTRVGSPRRNRHELLGLNSTSGYLDCFHTAGDAGPRRQERPASGTMGAGIDIVFDPPVPMNSETNYWYRSWWVNAFAMHGDEFRYLYPAQQTNDRTEFSQIIVRDPIEELSVSVQFPEDFEPAGPPRIRVTRPVEGQPPRTWPRVEQPEGAGLHYYLSLGSATARIRHPRIGLSYGIEWSVRERKAEHPKRPPAQPELDIRAITRKWEKGLDAEKQDKLVTVIGQALIAARKALMADEQGCAWQGFAEASFSRFDAASGHLRILAAVEGRDLVVPVDGSSISFPYGRGIAGRAFKTKSPRWYIREEQSYQDQPGFYEEIPGQTPHEVVLGLPVRCPAETPGDPYGVICFGSTEVNCPMVLRKNLAKVTAFQDDLERFLYWEFRTIFQM
jgi:3',5'-cyclic AMP phosphodiesterase CpdA